MEYNLKLEYSDKEGNVLHTICAAYNSKEAFPKSMEDFYIASRFLTDEMSKYIFGKDKFQITMDQFETVLLVADIEKLLKKYYETVEKKKANGIQSI